MNISTKVGSSRVVILSIVAVLIIVAIVYLSFANKPSPEKTDSGTVATGHSE